MSGLKRYDEPDGDHRGMKRDEDGDFVLFEDYDAIQRKLDVAVAMLESIRDEECYGVDSGCMREFIDETKADAARALREIGGDQ